MDAFRRVEGVVCPLDRADVDTDQIIPKQFLKRIERTGFGEFLFWDWRGEEGFPLDRPEYAGAPILVAGRNFGCGSSREHAPWALEDFGFRAVIAPSFADIFRTNCTKIGLLPVQLPEDQVRVLMEQAEGERARERIGVRREAFDRTWRSDLPFVGRNKALVLGPGFDPAACAGAAQRCSTSWREWGERHEAQFEGSRAP